MGKITGFLEIDRQDSESLIPEKRVKNFNELFCQLQISRFLNRHQDAWTVASHFAITVAR